MVEPILKWAGGKRQLLDELKSHIPQSYNDFYEPFFGGGALFFDLQPNSGRINDRNKRLVNFYEIVRDNPDKLINLAEEFCDPESDPDPERRYSDNNRKGKEISNYYYQQREIFNCRPNDERLDNIEEAALLLYLNRTCFNGLYRENKSGEFNVPIGRYANPDWVREKQIREASNVLDNVEIDNKDFSYIIDKCDKDDFVYFDPPYQPMSATESFTDYSSDGFDRSDQERLLKIAENLDDKGVNIVLSNSGVMYDMYNKKGFNVDRVDAKRSINSDGDNRGDVKEIIAYNT